MLIVAIGYFYVVATLSIVYMAYGKVALGLILMLFGAVMPVGLWLWFVSRRQRGRLLRFREELLRRATADASIQPEHDVRADTEASRQSSD